MGGLYVNCTGVATVIFWFAILVPAALASHCVWHLRGLFCARARMISVVTFDLRSRPVSCTVNARG